MRGSVYDTRSSTIPNDINEELRIKPKKMFENSAKVEQTPPKQGTLLEEFNDLDQTIPRFSVAVNSPI